MVERTQMISQVLYVTFEFGMAVLLLLLIMKLMESLLQVLAVEPRLNIAKLH